MSYTTISRIKKGKSSYASEFEFIQEINNILKKYDFSKAKDLCTRERILYEEGDKYVYQYTTHWESAEIFSSIRDSEANIESEKELIEKGFEVEKALPYL